MTELKLKSPRKAYAQALVELGKENKNIVVLDADLSSSTKTGEFKKHFPDRFFNMGIAEANMISYAAGIASTGKTVFASSFAMFAAGRAWEQIRTSVCYNNANVKIVATHYGITVGPDGATHQCLEDMAIMKVLPRMKVFSPADANEVKQIVKYVASFNGPAYVRITRPEVPDILSDDYKFEEGVPVLLKSGDCETVVFSTGYMSYISLKACEILEKQGIKVCLYNISTIKPLNIENFFEIISKHKNVFSIEDHSIIGGLGTSIADVIALKGLPVKLVKIGIKDRFGISGNIPELLRYFKIDPDSLAERIKETL